MVKRKGKSKTKEGGVIMRRKGKIWLFLVIAVLIGLFYSYTQAGTFTDQGLTTLTSHKVAKEVIDAGNVNATIGNFIKGKEYIPTQIPLGSLIGPTISISLDAGKFYVDSRNVAICRVSDNSTIAIYQTGSGTNELVFSESDTTISNNLSYWIGNSTCNGTAALTVEIPQNRSSITMTIKTGVGATQQVLDTASGIIIEAKPQFSAEVTEKLDAEIDYVAEFKKFVNGSNNDTAKIEVQYADLDLDVNGVTDDDDEVVTIVLKTTDISGISKVQYHTNFGEDPNTDCTKDEANKKFTCVYNSQNITGDKYAKLKVIVNGTTVLAERSFKVDVNLDFEDSKAKDKDLLTDVDFGKWTYRGTSVYIPWIATSTTRETYIRLQSKDTTSVANQVKAIILCSNGNLVTVDLGKFDAGQNFIISGAQLKARAQEQGCTVGENFAGLLNITTDEANLFGYASIIDKSTGFARRVPLKVSGGTIVE